MNTILAKHSDFLKQQIEYNERSATRYQADTKRSNSYAERAKSFRSLLADLEASADTKTESASSSICSHRKNNLHLMPRDIKDLPQELLTELGLSDADLQDFQILEIIDDMGGTTSLDKILVEIYRRTGKIEKRQKMVARLYRMILKGKLFSAEGRGVYTIIPSEDSPTT